MRCLPWIVAAVVAIGTAAANAQEPDAVLLVADKEPPSASQAPAAAHANLRWLANQNCASCHFKVPENANTLRAWTESPRHGIEMRLPKFGMDAADEGVLARWLTAHSAQVQQDTCLRHSERSKKSTYLGVSVSAVPVVLRRHLVLPRSMGLLVEAVEPDSPASTAGIQRYDILQKIDQQLLVNQEQFSVLLKTFAPATEIELTVIHRSQPLQLRAELGEREEAVDAADTAVQFLDVDRGQTALGSYYLDWGRRRASELLWDEAARNVADATVPLETKAAVEPGDKKSEPEPPKVKVAYLGVSVSQPAAALRQHLKLHPGTSLLIDEVIADSPAAAAGLKQYDVLQKLDEQLLINQEQFTVLIRAHKPGDEVRLTLIRQGQVKRLAVKLGTKEVEASPLELSIELGGDAELQFTPRVIDSARLKIDNLVRLRYKAADSLNKALDLRTSTDDDSSEAQFIRRVFIDLTGTPPTAAEVSAFNADPQADKRKRLVDHLLANPQAISRFNGAAALQWSDDEHLLTLSTKAGVGRYLLAKSKDGKAIFEGPVDSEDQRKHVPAQIAAKLLVMLQGAERLPGAPVKEPASAESLLKQVLPQFELTQVPLRQAIERLREQTGANLVVNWKSLKLAGVDADEPVSLSLRNARFSSVLTALLSLAGESLSYRVDDEVILISTK